MSEGNQYRSRALAAADIGTGDIAGLVVNTCTGYLCPGLSSYIVEDLGLKTSIRFHDLMGLLVAFGAGFSAFAALIEFGSAGQNGV